MIHVLNGQNSIFNQFLAELRDINIQKDRMRFRRNLERIGEIFSYEISKTFNYSASIVQTPINPVSMEISKEQVVIASVLRAGLPFHQGFLNYYDNAGSAFISARREYDGGHKFEIRYDSIYTPSLEGKQLLLVDPMLATGASLEVAYRELIRQGGAPGHTHIAAIIASRQGVDYLLHVLKGEKFTLWVGAVDEKLTDKAYIDPGLGDAGDLAFGEKK